MFEQLFSHEMCYRMNFMKWTRKSSFHRHQCYDCENGDYQSIEDFNSFATNVFIFPFHENVTWWVSFIRNENLMENLCFQILRILFQQTIHCNYGNEAKRHTWLRIMKIPEKRINLVLSEIIWLDSYSDLNWTSIKRALCWLRNKLQSSIAFAANKSKYISDCVDWLLSFNW